MTIKLFWHGGDKGEINFGDTVSPLVVEAVSGKPVQFADIYHCDLIAMGSILDKTIRRQWKKLARLRFHPTWVWGSGSLNPANVAKHINLRVAAVRGPQTAKAMGLVTDTAIGDPGLFVDRLPRTGQPHHRWGVVPHIVDRSLASVQDMLNTTPNSTLIDLGDADLRVTMGKFAACDFIASSSLHGLIAADALGIPHVWLGLSDQINGGDWKFNDYLTSMERPAAQPLAPVADLRNLEGVATASSRQTVALRQQALEKAWRESGLA